MRSQGVALVLVLLSLLLAAVVAGGTTVLRWQGAVAARERATTALADAQAASGRTLMDAALLSVSQSIRSSVRTRLLATPPFLNASDLPALRQEAQSVADSLTCQNPNPPDIRIFFTQSACGEPLPQGQSLPGPTTLYQSQNASRYVLPFIGVLRGVVGETRQTRVVPGELHILAGSPSPSFFQLYANSGYQSDGTPSQFRGDQVWSGPVYVAGIPIFGRTYSNLPGPYFLAPFLTGICTAVSPTGCPGGRGAIEFVDVGAIRPESLWPSPLAPCYGTSCPKFSAGVDWQAPAYRLPEVFSRSGGVNLNLAGQEASVFLSLDSILGQPATRVEIRIGANTYVYRARGGFLFGASGTVPIASTAVVYLTGGGVRLAGPVDAPAWSVEGGLTLVSEGAMVIEGNLFPDVPACLNPAEIVGGVPRAPECPNLMGTGMLGLVSETSDIVLGLNSPPEVYLAASLLAPRGAFRPEGVPPEVRRLTLLGSVAVQHFDDFVRSGRGWTMSLVYDPRLQNIRPPAWPSLPLSAWGVFPTYTWGLPR